MRFPPRYAPRIGIASVAAARHHVGMKRHLVVYLLLALARLTPAAETPVPDGFGVNIHFTDPRPGEMKMLAAAGFTWVRMDLNWGATEREPGHYDFSAYDGLQRALDEHHMRAMLILDYANRHYDQGLSPHSEEGRQAFARWAAAAVTHFKGRGVLWEMYNEPNIDFWKPKPDVTNYIALARAVGKAIRAAAPREQYCGPATSTIPLPFLEACFRGGLLEDWDAVTVHPYRQEAPEKVLPEYARLRELIDRYAPKGKRVPIISGEWGYSTAWKGFDDERQAKYLPRQFLVNLMAGVPLSIWYDWHEDGTNPTDPEHHFGIVRHPYIEGREPVCDAKPAYAALQALVAALRGCRFDQRLAVGDPDDFVLAFRKGRQTTYAAWTLGAARDVAVEGRRLTLTDTPRYLTPADLKAAPRAEDRAETR